MYLNDYLSIGFVLFVQLSKVELSEDEVQLSDGAGLLSSLYIKPTGLEE